MIEEKYKSRYVTFGEAALLATTFNYSIHCKHFYDIITQKLYKDNEGDHNRKVWWSPRDRFSAPTKKKAASYLEKAILSLIDYNLVACIIGCTDDNIILSNTTAEDSFKRWYRLLTVSGNNSTVYHQHKIGTLIEGYTLVKDIKPTVGSLMVSDKYHEATCMIYELYVRGYLNQSIHKVMKEYKVTDYTVPEEDPLFDCPELLDFYHWFPKNKVL